MEYTLVDLWNGRRRRLSLCSISFANQGDRLAFLFAMALDRGANLRMAGQLPSPRSGLRDQSTHERGLDQNRHDPPYGAKARLSILRQVLNTAFGAVARNELLREYAVIIGKGTILKEGMKSKEMNLANIEVARITPMRNRNASAVSRAFGARIPRRKDPNIMTPQWCSADLLAIGYFTFVPLTIGNGTSAGHMSAMGRYENRQRPTPP